jgi:hypothetical protein
MVSRCPNGPLRSAAVHLSTDSVAELTENNSQPNHKRTKLWSGLIRDGPVRSNIHRTGPTQLQTSMDLPSGHAEIIGDDARAPSTYAKI